MLGPRPTPVQPAYRTGSTYTGVDESVVGCKPGIVKTVVKVDEGVYKTREVKLTLRYGGYDPDTYDGADGLVLSLTLPAKWLDGGVPIRRLRDAFIGHYRKKRPSARLAAAADEEWGLAIKDESMLLFSKKRLDDDADLTKALYDRQEVYAMTAWDWEDHEAKLAELRKAVVDDLAHTMRHVIHEPESIAPVVSRAQILPGATFVVLAGWYKQQCVLVTPEHTIADLKAYLHHKNGPRMPMEALDIGLRTADDSIEVLDGALTLQQVYEQSIAAAATLAKRLAASSGAALPDAPDLPADSPLAAVAAAAAPAHVAQVQALRRHAQQVAAPLEGQLAADGHQPLRDAARLDHLAVLLVLRARLLEVRVGRARGRRGCPRRLVRVARRTCTSSRRGARGRPRSVSRVSRADLVAYLVALHLASEHGLQVLGPRAAQAIAQAAVERVA
mmetsp:Transcript_10068/g.29513  ORF Transcript_10068/g.29513 Transcript_10068/m.29513 type:complete len:445 (-) Transcript_10068:77-1411(-)